MRAMPVGIENFRDLIEKEYYFVDKTNFIKDLLDDKPMVTLITRPRRFGKSLTLSMLQEFFDLRSAGDNLFEGLNITHAGEKYMQHKGKYPVILLKVNTISQGGLEDFFNALRKTMSELYREFSYLADSPNLLDVEKENYISVRDGEYSFRCNDLEYSLGILIKMLHKHHGIKPIVLIDDYDAPMQYAWDNGFYYDLIKFMCIFYGYALKTNFSLEFAVMTGSLRAAQISMDSSINHVACCSLMSFRYNDVFGFTNEEVVKMARELGYDDKLPEIKEWYGGYNFGDVEIYNPYSVMQYFQNECRPAVYWGNTYIDGVIFRLIKGAGKLRTRDIHNLLDGGEVHIGFADEISYYDIGHYMNSLCFTMLLTGYLKYMNEGEGIFGREMDVKIPNKEIYNLLKEKLFQDKGSE